MLGSWQGSSVAASIGLTQIIGWGTVLYFPAALGREMAKSVGGSLELVFGGVSAMYVVAALLAPWIGRQIDARGARLVMTAGSVVAAAGFLLLSTAESAPHYIAAWILLGGMAAASLSQAAYAAIAQAVRTRTTQAFAILMFATGLAGTLCLPVVDLVGGAFGWRAVALAAAALHLAVCAPLHWFVLPRHPRPAAPEAALDGADAPQPRCIGVTSAPRGAFTAIAIALSFNIFVTTGLALHLVGILTEAGLSRPNAILLASAAGPILIAVRAAQIVAADRIHPVESGLVGAIALPLGISILAVSASAVGSVGFSAAAAFVSFFAVSNALMVVARAAIPFAVFGPARFGSWTGRLGTPQNLASALTPIAFAFALESWKAQGAIVLALVASIVSFAALAFLAVSSAGRPVQPG